MAEYEKPTDQVHEITLTSELVHALWCGKVVFAGKTADLEVWTHLVGDGSEIKTTVHDGNNRAVGKLKGEVHGNRFKGSFPVPEKTEGELTFTAALPKHGLQLKSEAVKVIPPVDVSNMRWGVQEASRGDILKLSADIKGVPDETEVQVTIYEHDKDGAHDYMTRFSTTVQDERMELEWECEHPANETDVTPGKEMNPAEPPDAHTDYFFTLTIANTEYGKGQESGLLKIMDSGG